MRADENTDSIMLNIRAKELDIRQLEQEIADLKTQDAGPDPITAPIDGKLTGFDVEAGDRIRENAELGEVVNYSGMKLVISVDELDIAKVEVGQRAEVRATRCRTGCSKAPWRRSRTRARQATAWQRSM